MRVTSATCTLTTSKVRSWLVATVPALKSHPGSADKLQPIRRVRAESSLGLGWRLEKMGRICLWLVATVPASKQLAARKFIFSIDRARPHRRTAFGRMLKSHPGSADKLQPIRRVRAESSLGLGWRLEKMYPYDLEGQIMACGHSAS
jgi:hypothetical protein